MKKTLLIAIFSAVIFVGCSEKREQVSGVESVSSEYKTIINDGSGKVDYTIIVIDGCEYIFGRDYGGYNGGYFLTHKGNCKNKAHQPPAGSP